MNVALILAGGVGSRVGANRPKQFVEILNKPILAYTIENYQKHPEIDAIEVVCHIDWIDYLEKMLQKYQLTKVQWIIHGGETFQKSVINGMNNLRNKISKEDIVMLHYGAAPFTSEKIIRDSIRVCKEFGMSVSCTPCYQLIGSNNERATSKTWIDRDKIIQLACPQSFIYKNLLNIYEEAGKQGLLEKVEPHTTSLMYALGMTLHQSYGDQTNIKITTEEDLDMFEGYVLMCRRKTISIK